MTAVVATALFVLLVAACWLAARYDPSPARTPSGRRDTPRAVFGRGMLAVDGTWRPVGLPEPAPGPGGRAPRPSRPTAARREVVR